jgi:death-on-curing protein
MKSPRWVNRDALVLLHQESLAQHGGRMGVLDAGLLESALARPHHIFCYNARSDLAGLAAAYATGLVRNHPFADGNKRAAFLAVGLFLELNGLRLAADPADAARAVLSLAAGKLSERQFAQWIRDNLKRRR